VGPAHSPEDLTLRVEPDSVLFAGDVATAGRIPFVGDADTAAWVRALDLLRSGSVRCLVPGHGPAIDRPDADLSLMRDYLQYLRDQMRQAVDSFVSFDDAYARTDWSRFSRLPAFAAANRGNAYNVYLEIEREVLAR
jgi:glyoxylase-like metal-dependent hydrolase (beta-lactamase superfamily II)